MSTNEPPVDPTADPAVRPPAAVPAAEPSGAPSTAPEPDVPPPAPGPAIGVAHPVSAQPSSEAPVTAPPWQAASPAEPTPPTGTPAEPVEVPPWQPPGTPGVYPAPPGTPVPAPPGNLPPVPPVYPPAAPPTPADPNKRPGVVLAAAGILLLLALCGLGQSLLSLISMGGTVDRFKDRARLLGASQSDIDATVSQLRVSYVFGVIFTILIALALVGLAYGLLRGGNGARIVTWVVCGLAVICDCCSTFFYFGISGVNLTGENNNSMQTQLAQAQIDAFPGWFLATAGSISLLQLLGYIAVAVLLALPDANAFFRKRTAPGWVPPTS